MAEAARDRALSALARSSRSRRSRPRSDAIGFLWFIAKLVVVVFLIRSVVAAPFTIPSESMLPGLIPGDYLLATKWDYGWSRASFPGGNLPISGRIWGGVPDRGDVVIFRAPEGDRRDFVKRVIGLPGDTVALREGRLVLNGRPVPRDRVADLVHPVAPNLDCAAARFRERGPDGPRCRYPRYRETLPSGRSYEVVDLGPTVGDSIRPLRVPEGQLFLLGDHRDRSADSRSFGTVPVDRLIGRARITLFSTDGSAEWLKPWTWGQAARWDRVGGGG